MNIDKDKRKTLSSNTFPVVGIGASAGGLDAFKKLLKAIPVDSGMAYVLVQHLDPNHTSLLPELLQKVANIPVLEISDDIKVLPDHIYIIPSNKMLVANDGVLQLSPRHANKNERNLPIDLFFGSLAEVHQEHAIGVVLSGTGADGTLGLKAIKDQGGITFAQDEASAAFDGMPSSAVNAGVVDFILPPEEIPKRLFDIKAQINRSDEELQNIPQREEDLFKQILSLLRVRKGADFTYYKQTTVRRRILRRMALRKLEEPTAYLECLREHKGEQDALYQDLLIPVTAFFRDPKVFDRLCESVFPNIVKNKTSGEPIRIWVVGCSTGQEAYSMAICLKEFLGNEQEKVQIFATDISEPAIAKARSGVYTKSEVEGITPQRLQEFFTKVDGHYRVNKQVRDMCVFAKHNFLKDPPFGRMDLVSCRNVLIYLEPYLQKKALTTFHYALAPKGFLLLGKAETSTGVSNLFAQESKSDKLFTRKDQPARFMQVASQLSEQSLQHVNTSPQAENKLTDFQKTADDIVLAKYTPAGVVVTESLDIVHFRGNTTMYLEQSPGKPSHNLMKMAKSSLAFELRNMLYKAKKENTTIVKENVPVLVAGQQHSIAIEVIPLPNIVEPHFLILFHDRTSTQDHKKEPADGKLTGKSKKDDKDLLIEHLEKELAQTREDMRSVSEEQEAANEELQSANEELLSGSEELQSLNEELETSKEELQSTNEELTVVNQELVNMNEQVIAAQHYAESIVATIREPLLVLDKNLRIRTANKAFYKTFHVNERDTESALIYHLGNKQWDIPALRVLLEEILLKTTVFKDFEVTHNFPNIGERVMLLNACKISGENEAGNLILLSIEDITDKKFQQLKDLELLGRFKNLAMLAPVPICILKGADYIVEIVNDYYLQLVEKSKDFVGKPYFDAIPELKTQGIRDLLNKVMHSGIPLYGHELELNILRNNKSDRCFFNFVYQPLREHGESVTGIIIVATEVTDQVIARKRMEAQALMVENLLINAPAFICTLKGPGHIYELVNQRYQDLFGTRKIKGKPIMVALPELKGQGFDTLLDKVYNTGKPYIGIDIPITLARDENLEPEERFFNFSYQPMYDEDKKIYSILVFGYEVTDQVIARNKNLDIHQKHAIVLEEMVQQRTLELKTSNDLLLLSNKELANKNNELESFVYVSSHDLQEPLRKIETFASRILEKENQNLSADGKDNFKRMQTSATRMRLLIQNLLAFSTINKVDRTFESVDLNLMIEEVKNELQELIEEKGATVECSGVCKATIIAFQFRQLLHNLIFNALKFSRPGIPPHIIIEIKSALGDKLNNDLLLPKTTYCHIMVQDNGIGFEPEFGERIFQVFQQLNSKAEYEGTGIGLSIVKKIVENHNGLITATGELGKGATFDIYVPTA